jgi:methionyl-tRNA formyltransferase
MEALLDKTATFTPQDDSESSHVGMIKKEMGLIDWNLPAVEIERLIRGLNPWPSAYTVLDGKTFKIWKAKVICETSKTDDDKIHEAKQPGTITHIGKNELIVQTGEGELSLLEVQLAGKKRMDIGSFLRGYGVEPGKGLESEKNI